MLPDHLLTRSLLGLSFGLCRAILPLTLVLFPVTLCLLPVAWPLALLLIAEWTNYHRFRTSHTALDQDQQGTAEGQGAILSRLERWSLLKKSLDAQGDPDLPLLGKTWDNGFLQGWFHSKSHDVLSNTGIGAPSVGPKKEDVHRENLAQFLSEVYFDHPLEHARQDPPTSSEIDEMIAVIEAAIHRDELSSNAGKTEIFRFAPGRNDDIEIFIPRRVKLQAEYHPLVFYAITTTLCWIGDIALWLSGFRYYVSRKGIYNNVPAWMMGKAPHDVEASEVANGGYWYHPGWGRAGRGSTIPINFMHGMSGLYGPTLFILLLLLVTGRPIFAPSLPYVMMRQAPVSSIIARRQYVAMVRKMLKEHGYHRALAVGHSLGSVLAAWLARDAPELNVGMVLVDPGSILLHQADSVRNFFRTSCSTAGEIFFQFFATELGICFFMSRFVNYNDSILFSRNDVAEKEVINADLDRFRDVDGEWKELHSARPRHRKSTLVKGGDDFHQLPLITSPESTRVYLSEYDCIVPSHKVEAYIAKVNRISKSKGEGCIPCHMMMGLDHAAVLFHPRWLPRIARDVKALLDRLEGEGKVR